LEAPPGIRLAGLSHTYRKVVTLVLSLATNNDSLINGKRGAVFVAPAGSVLPTDLSKLTLANDAPDTNWKNLGHTSESNLPSWDRSGGDATSLNSWLSEGVKTTYDSVTISVSVKSLQADKGTLGFIYNGWTDTASNGVAVALNPASQDVALVVLSYDPDSRKPFGTYMSNVSLKADGMPDFSGDFVEFGFTATVQTSSVITASSTGDKAAFVFLTPDLFVPQP
jgi:hypothetical protein